MAWADGARFGSKPVIPGSPRRNPLTNTATAATTATSIKFRNSASAVLGRLGGGPPSYP
ncbi:hypothetical protein AHiyo8_21360 [Arthrobacter sp. Hiyo8]|nr:hypothetical protein AHiyo8_21360 [Arthrobacter sp. Hiyo8]